MKHFLVIAFSAAALFATPQLRLSTSAIGPFNIAVGQNGTVQTVSASNIGDGTLSLTATSSVPWITATVAGSNVQIGLPTSSLAQGIFTGIVTVNAAGAIDGMQTITVTVQMGGGVPNSMNLFLPPGGSVSAPFAATPNLNPVPSAVGGGLTLTVLSAGGGSFDTTATYVVKATAPATATPETSYSGKITVNNSTFAPDNKQVPVTLNVTNLPIVTLSPASLQFNVALGAAPVAKWIQLSNSGATALAITGATVSSGANNSATSWLTTSISGSTVVATGDPTGLATGKYTATITIASNAKNGPLTVPVEMDVVAVGPPVSYYQGVVDNALFAVGEPVAPGGLVLVRGDQFTMGKAAVATTLPLGTSLGGATVYVNGAAAPIYYSAASNVVNAGGQITFQMPYSTPPGQATIRVDRNDNGTVQTGNTISVPVEARFPALLQFALNGNEYAIATFTDFVTFPIPVTPGVPSRPAKVGDVLIFYGLGFGATTPPVTEGVAVPGLTNIAGCVMVFGQSVVPSANIYATPSFCGLTPGLVGLYQVNVTVPAGTPTGNAVPISLVIGGATSNSASIAIQ
ncbi:MAG TPA: hypothetical protein VMT15_02810 [Bryobacteraceae bacterium]|nr:hypothetical protein [Bryobacteraceae bacterium]